MDFLYTFLISISPLGEARVGIPYGVLKGVPVVYAFLIGWGANLFVYPLFYKGIKLSNEALWKSRWYKKSALYLSKRAKSKTKSSIQKYGLWGLMVFVMIPLPITGAYMGTLAAYILRMDYKKSLIAVNVGVTISCLIIATMMYFGEKTF
ncbi:MAG: small multi-drug export protein [Vicingaceae bacterium]|nr:small multi-drug export protein [Vicingaceae bacterium]